MKGRRKLLVAAEVLETMFKVGMSEHHVVGGNRELPEDAELVDCQFDYDEGGIWLIFESQAWDYAHIPPPEFKQGKADG